VRKQYWDILGQKLREGGFGWIAEAGSHVVGTWLSDRVGRPLVGPSLGTLIITYRCNYFCEFCELPARAVRRKKEGIREFTREETLQVVRGFKALRTSGIGITGGEPMIRKDIYDVLSEITRLGMVAHINTNGHFLNEENVRRLIATGLSSINISLDAPDAETHNRIRGNRRSYEQIMKAVAEVLRQRKNGKPRVGLTTVLLGSNVEKALEMAALAREIGVDSLGFIPIHEYHDGSDLGEILKRREFAEKSRETIKLLKADNSGILENSDRYLSLFPKCFAGRPSGLKCYAPWNSMVIDCYGRVFPCVPLSEIDEPLDTITADGVVDCWRGEKYQKKREELTNCQACYWNCHTESNLLFQRVPRDAG
jgi:MoaA/NifB/PqqE/SkfB family radical SAM enzyme